MASVKINNLERNVVKSIECLDSEDKIRLLVNINGTDHAVTLQTNDAQILQSWLFLNIKRIKQNG